MLKEVINQLTSQIQQYMTKFLQKCSKLPSCKVHCDCQHQIYNLLRIINILNVIEVT